MKLCRRKVPFASAPFTCEAVRELLAGMEMAHDFFFLHLLRRHVALLEDDCGLNVVNRATFFESVGSEDIDEIRPC